MPRRPRLMLAGVPMHVIQRGNNRQACFFADDDYGAYLAWLQEYAITFGCSVHAFVLMTNHVHLLLQASKPDGMAAMMKALGQRYTQYVNRTYERSGTLWEGRYRSCPTQDERYLLACMRYIELNPVRAGMVGHPGEYRWSSYGANAQGDSSSLLTGHPVYEALGVDLASRCAAYRELFRIALSPEIVHEIRLATNGNYALGDARFGAQIEAALGRRAQRGKPGRRPGGELVGPGLRS